MRFQVKKIVLWPRNPAFRPRELDFALGQVNVITGASKTGKSAVIPIVDYCLGSDRCSIPVRTIRDACSWFGVVVATDEGEKLFAREEPGEQQSTGNMFVLEAPQVKVPPTIPEKNTTVEAVRRMLDRLSGLSNLGFDPTGIAGSFKGRPSFRDLSAFTFQPQNIVANADVLFYKADTMEHREKLKTIFPYVIGAITPDMLAKRWEADQLQKELRRKERELEVQANASATWKAELRDWVSGAQGFGLVSPEEADAANEESDLIGILKDIARKTSQDAEVTATGIEASSQEAADLDKEEASVALSLAEVRTRLEQMLSLRSSVDEYTGALKKQRERLELSRWLRDLPSKDIHCPICGSENHEAQRELDALCDALAEVEASARQISPVPAVFDRELVQVRERVRGLTDQLQAVRVRKRGLAERSATIRLATWRAAEVNRFLGRLEQALKIFVAPDIGQSIREEVDRLRKELEELKSALSESGIRNRIRAALSRVSASMSRILPALDTERPNDPAELNVDDLTIRITSSSGRADYLWEIGSGANWLSYHVAAILSLHRLFLEQGHSPVPTFVFFDQPSQVYFPQKLAHSPPEGADPQLSDEDAIAVRKVFAVLGDSVIEARGALQIVVLDHAGNDVWGNLPGVSLVEEWRGGRALVPPEWIRS